MLTSLRRLPRSPVGASLAELVVAIAVGAVVLAIVSRIALRQQRFFATMFDVLAVTGQLSETAAILPVDLRGLATGAGDVRAAEARDTSLEARVTIASGVICDTNAGRVVLAPSVSGVPSFAGALEVPQVNDTAWILTVADTTERWEPRRISDVSSARAGPCTDAGPVLSGVALAVGRASYRLDSASSAPAATATPGVPIRVTRPARYSLYRASDGAWYLGQRDWNPATLRFNTIQPVSGPFLSAASDGLHFRYFDSTGAELPSGTSSTRSIALIRIALNAQTQRVVHASGFAVTSAGRHADSVLVTVRARNRR